MLPNLVLGPFLARTKTAMTVHVILLTPNETTPDSLARRLISFNDKCVRRGSGNVRLGLHSNVYKYIILKF